MQFSLHSLNLKEGAINSAESTFNENWKMEILKSKFEFEIGTRLIYYYVTANKGWFGLF